MLFKDVSRINKSDAMDLWLKKLNNVDQCIARIQDSDQADAWSLNYWQNVRMALTRQINQINYENR